MLMKNMISFFSFGIEHNDGTLPSMRDRVGEDIDDDHSGNNQDQPDDGSQVEVLFENEKADKRDKNDTTSTLQGVFRPLWSGRCYDRPCQLRPSMDI